LDNIKVGPVWFPKLVGDMGRKFGLGRHFYRQNLPAPCDVYGWICNASYPRCYRRTMLWAWRILLLINKSKLVKRNMCSQNDEIIRKSNPKSEFPDRTWCLEELYLCNSSNIARTCLATLGGVREAVKCVMRFYWPWPSMTLLYNIIYNGKWETDRNQTRLYLFSLFLFCFQHQDARVIVVDAYEKDARKLFCRVRFILLFYLFSYYISCRG
jgi:hypothetical protein